MKLTKKLIMGVSAILITFTGSTLAIKNPINWAKCKYCNARPGKCAKDEKFYLDCRTKCQQPEGKSDPIQKCNDAHFSQQASSAPSTISRPENVVSSLLSPYSCKDKQLMVDMDAKVAPQLGRRPYSEKEKQVILGDCSSALVPYSTELDESTSSSTMTRDEALAVMGLPKTATPTDVRKKYKKMALAMHPDKGGSEEEIRALNEAHNVLQQEEEENASSSSIPALMPPEAMDTTTKKGPPALPSSYRSRKTATPPHQTSNVSSTDEEAPPMDAPEAPPMEDADEPPMAPPMDAPDTPTRSSHTAPLKANVTPSVTSGQSTDLMAALQAKQAGGLKKVQTPGSQKAPTSSGNMFEGSRLFKQQREANNQGQGTD